MKRILCAGMMIGSVLMAHASYAVTMYADHVTGSFRGDTTIGFPPASMVARFQARFPSRLPIRKPGPRCSVRRTIILSLCPEMRRSVPRPLDRHSSGPMWK